MSQQSARGYLLSAFASLLLLPFAALAELPQPAQFGNSVPAARDVPYPGVMRIHVDATDLDRHIFEVRQSIPVAGGGSVTLLYPEWLPANHRPAGRVDKIAGLKIYADGERIAWRRDPVNVFAFHVDVPEGTTSLDLKFQFLSPTEASQGRVVITPEMSNLQWTAVAFYPAGYFTRQIQVAPSVTLPDGWEAATALRVSGRDGNRIEYATVSFEDLIDSPMFAGRHFKRVDLDPGADRSVHLNIVADREDQLALTDEHLEIHRELVRQADHLFASRHFDHYEFLMAVTDRLGGIGLEHHQSSENSFASSLFLDWDANVDGRDLLAHEYVHSWNGKFRRPADMWTPDYDMPMRGSLLWLYEGQTQYWGSVLAARSGLHSQQEALEWLAWTAATYQHRIGREWRSLQDTTNDPVAADRRTQASRSWSRGEDYYSEGLLIWLDADTLIRELSKGRKSLDDFASAFFGVNDGSRVPVTYTFEDVVDALNSVQEYDWERFLRERVEAQGTEPPLDGIARGGYELVYTEEPSGYMSAYEAASGANDLMFSVGLRLASDGLVWHVLWDSPAFREGIAVGEKVLAVNGIAYNIDRLKHAITASKDGQSLIELLVQDGEHFRTVSINYDGGLRYPHLQRSNIRRASLDKILEARRR